MSSVCAGSTLHLQYTQVIRNSHERKLVYSELFLSPAKHLLCLTLSPPAVKTQHFSQCQASQHLVRSSHILVNWILNNFRSTELIFNQFSVFLKTLNALCVYLQYKHHRSMKRVIRSDKPITSVFPVKSQKCDFGAEPRCRLIVTSAGKGLIHLDIRSKKTHIWERKNQCLPKFFISGMYCICSVLCEKSEWICVVFYSFLCFSQDSFWCSSSPCLMSNVTTVDPVNNDFVNSGSL
jgi:hypothetical protein